jgi:hypothetical protein
VYVAAVYSGGNSEHRSWLAVFARNPKTGAVKQLPARKGRVGGNRAGARPGARWPDSAV